LKKQQSAVSCQLSVKKILTLLVTGYWLLVTAASAVTADDIVKRIQAKYNKIQDLQGSFSQTSYLKDLDRVENYEGTFFIKKTVGIKWAYSKPRDEEVLIRGSETWIYKKSEKQVLKTALGKDAYNQTPMALLGSLGSLKDDFFIKMIKQDTLELTPKHKTGFIKKISLEISSGDFPVKTFSILDIHGNKIRIEVKGVKINSGLKDSLFMFRVPKDIEVFDLNQ